MKCFTDGKINYNDCLLKICNQTSIDCCFSNCETCPSIDEIKEILEDDPEKHLIETLTFCQ